MNPAWTLADKVKAKQLLLRKVYAPWMSELAAAIIDATQAKVLQNLAERIHRDMGRR
jgi:predicted phosphoribosyltransferase